MTARPEIREAAAVAVPDAKYGEVVGVWIVREPHTHISRDDVRSYVAKVINPQVRIMSQDSAAFSLTSFFMFSIVYPFRMRRRGFGLSTRTAQMKSYQRQLVGRL